MRENVEMWKCENERMEEESGLPSIALAKEGLPSVLSVRNAVKAETSYYFAVVYPTYISVGGFILRSHSVGGRIRRIYYRRGEEGEVNSRCFKNDS